MDSTYGQKIFKHELTHIHQKHTLDILFTQVVNAIFWMNPFNWLIQKELKTIHEFIADKEAIGNNDVEDFARLLLQAHYGNHFLNPTHSFYYSSIKRRLIMLSTTHRTKFSYLRRVLVLPLSVMAIAALSVSTIQSKATPVETPAAPAFTQPALQSDTTPKAAPTKLKQQPAKKTPKESEKGVPGVKITAYNVKGNMDFSNNRDESKPNLSANAEKIFIQVDTTVRPEFTVRAADEVRINQVDSTAKSDITFNGIYFYDGKQISLSELNQLQGAHIKSMNVWKKDAAVKKFGPIGVNGVVELFSKKNPD